MTIILYHIIIIYNKTKHTEIQLRFFKAGVPSGYFDSSISMEGIFVSVGTELVIARQAPVANVGRTAAMTCSFKKKNSSKITRPFTISLPTPRNL